MYYLLLIISFLINSNYFFLKKDVKTNVNHGFPSLQRKNVP